MSQAKEAPLDGAYYGPPIPPQQAYHRHQGCCVLSTLMKVFIATWLSLGIAALVFCIVVRPNKVKFYVVSADLTQFDLTNGNTLIYNLTLDVAVRNPNKKIGIYFDTLDATACYDGERFGWMSLPQFYQGHKNTTTLHLIFRGQSVMVLGGSDINDFNGEKSTGFFYIDVKFYARIMFKIGSIKTRRIKPWIECNLRIPLASNGTMISREFESTRCEVEY